MKTQLKILRHRKNKSRMPSRKDWVSYEVFKTHENLPVDLGVQRAHARGGTIWEVMAAADRTGRTTTQAAIDSLTVSPLASISRS